MDSGQLATTELPRSLKLHLSVRSRCTPHGSCRDGTPRQRDRKCTWSRSLRWRRASSRRRRPGESRTMCRPPPGPSRRRSCQPSTGPCCCSKWCPSCAPLPVPWDVRPSTTCAQQSGGQLFIPDNTQGAGAGSSHSWRGNGTYLCSEICRRTMSATACVSAAEPLRQQ